MVTVEIFLLEAVGNIELNDSIETFVSIGDSGDVTITSTEGSISFPMGSISTGIQSAGNGGDVTLTAKLDIQTNDITTIATDGNAGAIAIATTDGKLLIEGPIWASVSGQGDSGDVTLMAKLDIQTSTIATNNGRWQCR